MPPPESESPRGKSGCAWTVIIVVLILALLAGFIFYRLERMAESGVAGITDWGRRVRDAVVAVTGMQPRVTVNEQVVVEQAQPVLELAVLERDLVVERETESSWMGSTKRLRIRGLYHVKAGYDLRKNFTVDVLGSNAEVVRLQMPPPRVLSVELKHTDVLTMDDGFWNHLSKDELDSEINFLGLEANLKARQNGTLAEAQRLFVEQLEGKLGPGHRVEFATPTPAAVPSAPK